MEQSSDQPLLASVVILNWNGGDFIGRAVESSLSQTWPHVDVIVVDNGSNDGSVEVVEREYGAHIRIIRNQSNLGYAAGMNQGISIAKGDLIVPLNCDAVLDRQFIEIALSTAAAGAASVLAPLVYRFDRFDSEPTGIDGGKLYISPWMTVVQSESTASRRVFKPNGSAPCYTRAAVDLIQRRCGYPLFDPIFDTYGEDVDVAFKMLEEGVPTLYCPELVVYHRRSYASTESVKNKRGRLRINVIFGRHANTLRHAPTLVLPLVWVAVLATDAALAALCLARRDVSILGDMKQAYGKMIASWRQVTNGASIRRLTVRALLPFVRVRRHKPPLDVLQMVR